MFCHPESNWRQIQTWYLGLRYDKYSCKKRAGRFLHSGIKEDIHCIFDTRTHHYIAIFLQCHFASSQNVSTSWKQHVKMSEVANYSRLIHKKHSLFDNQNIVKTSLNPLLALGLLNGIGSFHVCYKVWVFEWTVACSVWLHIMKRGGKFNSYSL